MPVLLVASAVTKTAQPVAAQVDTPRLAAALTITLPGSQTSRMTPGPSRPDHGRQGSVRALRHAVERALQDRARTAEADRFRAGS